MLSLDDARAHLLGALDGEVWPSETVPLHEARGRVLASDVGALVNVPAWDNAGMDGFALRCADVSHAGVSLCLLCVMPSSALRRARFHSPWSRARWPESSPVHRCLRGRMPW